VAVVEAGEANALLRGGEPLEERLADVPGAERGRVRAAAGPVDPGDAAVGDAPRRLEGEHGGQVVLVRVAGRAAVLLELGVVAAVGDGEVAVQLEPLRALAPLVAPHLGGQAGAVAAAAVRARVVEGADEAVAGAGEVGVRHGEGEERHARLGEQHEAVVPRVQQRVRQQPPLRVADARLAPTSNLRVLFDY
jgi:hypothetical protein